MIRDFVCLNCRESQIASARLEESCPNCGAVMQSKPWSINEIERFHARLRCQKNRRQEFVSMGSLESQEPMLLSYAMNEKYLRKALDQANVSILFVREEDARGVDTPISLVFSEHPQSDFFLFHNHLIENTDFYGRASETIIAPTAQIHPSAVIAEKNVIVEDDVVIGPNTTVMGNTIIDAGTSISPGVVLGVFGARLISRPDGSRFVALHGGSVSVGKNVVIGANAVIVRSVWRKPTRIGDGAFIGNLVNIGHNCQVADGATVLPGAILCGRAEVGPGAMVSPGAIITNGVYVGARAWVTLGAVVTRDVAPDSRVSGNFAIPHSRLVEHIKELTRTTS